MHFTLPTPDLDLPCTVPNFMAIPAVMANPHTRYRDKIGLIVVLRVGEYCKELHWKEKEIWGRMRISER